MRARSIRLSILILLLLGLALLSLGFKDINVDLPGFPELKRGGTGPLGLKLGLDLRGGAHLVYQADTGTRFDVTFLDPIFTQQVENALGELRFGEQQLAFENFAVDSLGASRIRIKTGLLDGNDPRRTEFQETMVEELGSIEAVTITDTDAPTVEEMEGALDTINRRVNLFGTEEPI
ncbi:MAG: hypothetical protein QF714_11870, partial [Dehalococcoidia bacterium]|nr:hypothetical protein [Dehalococcoidia bacterium]